MIEPEDINQQLAFADSTQLAMIVADLRAGRRLTPLQALEDYKCFRLAAQIHALRRVGWMIHTELCRKGRKVWAEYSLIASPAAARHHNDQRE